MTKELNPRLTLRLFFLGLGEFLQVGLLTLGDYRVETKVRVAQGIQEGGRLLVVNHHVDVGDAHCNCEEQEVVSIIKIKNAK